MDEETKKGNEVFGSWVKTGGVREVFHPGLLESLCQIYCAVLFSKLKGGRRNLWQEKKEPHKLCSVAFLYHVYTLP